MPNLIRFTCQKCGACCKVGGYVFLKKGEAERIAAKLAIPPEEFKKKYTKKYIKWIFGYCTSLISSEAGVCIFLKNNRCMIYDARPEQCSSWPYWKKILNNKTDLMLAKLYCKGIE